ncbi:M16 family metallopeptidase [Caminicella sporogenes]|nr:pitrilysin family protein [Caminicella sporogenes]RKD28040.1 peptidase M16 [Caminicella sporogenes]
MNTRVFDYKEHRLKNGINLVSIKRDTRLFCINIGINIGAINEKISEKGICHFIEHMLFKGTKKRDNNQINYDLEKCGGNYDAYTNYTSTVFSVTALAEELESSVEVLSDILINSTFPKNELEKERGVILSEIKSCIDDIEDYSFSKVHSLAFEKSPLKYDVIGSEKNIKMFTRKQLLKFYKENYIPSRCIIAVVSPYEHDKIKEIIERYFGDWNNKTVGKKKEVIITERNKSIEKISYKNNIEQNTLIYLYTFYGLTREEEIALDILNHKLGVSANSILFRALREERGLAYDIYSEMDATEFIKTLYIYTAVEESNVWEAKKIIEESIEKIKNRKIILEEKDINLMKKIIKTSIAAILEDSSGLCNYALNQKLMNKRIDGFIEDLKKLDYISVEDIYKVAQKVLIEPTVHILMNKKAD